MTETLRREVRFEPGFARRWNGPCIDQNIFGMNIRFLLVGEKGAAQFRLFIDWLPDPTATSYAEVDSRADEAREAFPPELGVHARIPQYAGQILRTEDCPMIGGPCYYDGGAQDAEAVYWALMREGDAVVWRTLQEIYDGISADGV